MRSLILLFGVGQLSGIAFAQVVITADNIPLQGGRTFPYAVVENYEEGLEVDLGEGGADEVWDLSSFSLEDFTSLYQDSLLEPDDAPYRQEFPDANRVVMTAQDPFGFEAGGGAGFIYQLVDENGWYVLGVVPPEEDTLMPFVWQLPEPVPILTFPARMGEQFENLYRFSFGMNASDIDDSLGAIFDSIYFHFEVGGTTSIDGWGRLRTPEEELPAIRTYSLWGGQIRTTGVRTILGRRIEIELFREEFETQHVYRWYAPGLGEVAVVASLFGEEDPNFTRAGHIRVRWVGPRLQLDQELLAFGVVEVGNSQEGSLTITNQGRSPVVINRVDFSEAIFHEMDILTGIPLNISPDSSSSLIINWTPSEERSLEGEYVYLWHNDPRLDNPLQVPLQGYTPLRVGEHRGDALPTMLSLEPIYPNPFNGKAEIRFAIPGGSDVSLLIADVRGRILWQKDFASGFHSFAFPLADLPSGIYFVFLKSPSQFLSQRAILMR
ncbi:MAG: T9SS type A sorting domain-containing protein [bacterium]